MNNFGVDFSWGINKNTPDDLNAPLTEMSVLVFEKVSIIPRGGACNLSQVLLLELLF